MKKIVLIILGILLSAVAPCAADAVTDDPNLVAYWKFDEGQGDTAYDLVGGNNGDIYGAQWTGVIIGTALDYNGDNDYVLIGYPVLPMGNKSLFAWVKMPPAPQGSQDTYDYIIFWCLSMFYFNNGVELVARNIWDGGYDARYVVALDDNKWHHVGFTYDEGTSTLRLYYDGVEVATDIGNDQHSIEHPARIGGREDDAHNRSWLGKIDEVIIYNKGLTPEEIERLYLDGLGDLEVDPLYDFEASGDVGGPFEPESMDYQLTNIGPNSISWNVSKTADWLDTIPSSGALDPNESFIVTVVLNTLAEALGGGSVYRYCNVYRPF